MPEPRGFLPQPYAVVAIRFDGRESVFSRHARESEAQRVARQLRRHRMQAEVRRVEVANAR